jgi:Fe2+ or Zn2+ uptake regulation protein
MRPGGEVLRDRGLRVTSQRQAVLTVLARSSHVTAAEIASGLVSMQAPSPSLSRQGLYNVLDDLTRVGLIRCIEPAGSPARYELRVGDNHHHRVCRTCGQIEDVDCAVGGAPCLTPSDQSGFVVDEAEVTWWGQCAICTSAASTTGPSTDPEAYIPTAVPEEQPY